MKGFLVAFSTLALIVILLLSFKKEIKEPPVVSRNSAAVIAPAPKFKKPVVFYSFKKITAEVARLKQFSINIGSSNQYYFVIDMSIPSGMKRFFVYSATTDTIVAAGLVTHGQGKAWSEQVPFSNEPGSYCSSTGVYKIGNAYNGSFGLAYKLYGLEATNSNAFNRFVVLHAHPCVPNEAVYPEGICMSQGCPTVAPEFLKVLSGYLNSAEKPILLSIIK